MTVGELKEFIKNMPDNTEIKIETEEFTNFCNCDAYCANIYDENSENKRKDIIVICKY
jgi:hypothetical protein